MKQAPPLFELVEIDRRQFLRLAGGALVSLSALGLAGCGGSGGRSSSPSGRLTKTSGTIQFPSGFSTTKLKGLTVSNVYNSVIVDPSMGFQLGTDQTNPSLAYVKDSTGAVIFFGFVDPSSKTNVLGPTSTAAALLYFALDGYMSPPSNNAAILALIGANPSVATLANVIGQRVLANPYAVNVGDSAILAALKAAFGAATTSAIAMSRSETGGNRASAPRTTSDPAQLTIEGGLQSGFNVNVDPTGATTSFTGQNTFRRYCRVYVYQTSTTDSSGTIHTLASALPIGDAFDVASTQRLNIGTALKDFFTTTSPFSPVTTAAVPLETPSGAVAATFDVIVIGSSALYVDPSFFSDGIYSIAVSTWRDVLETLNLRTAIMDVFFGLILNMIGVTSIESVPPINIDAAVASLETIGEAAWQASIKQAAASAANLMSPVSYAAKMLQNGAMWPLTSSQWAQDVWEAYDVLAKGANVASASAISEASFAAYLAVGFRVILGAITGASIVLGTGDLAAVYKDMTNSHKGDLWSATLAIPPIHLVPTTVSIVPGSTGPTLFTASPPTGATGPFKWTWTLAGQVSAKLTDEEGNEGITLTQISSSTVYLVTTKLDINPMTVTVEGFVSSSSGVETSIGKAKASVSINSNKQTITPGYATVTFEDYVCAFATFTPSSTDTDYSWAGTFSGGEKVLGAVFQSTIAANKVPVLSPTDLWTNAQYYGYPMGTDTSYTGLLAGAFNLGGKVGFLFGTYRYADYTGSNQTEQDGLTALAEAWSKYGPGVITINDTRFTPPA